MLVLAIVVTKTDLMRCKLLGLLRSYGSLTRESSYAEEVIIMLRMFLYVALA